MIRSAPKTFSKKADSAGGMELPCAIFSKLTARYSRYKLLRL